MSLNVAANKKIEKRGYFGLKKICIKIFKQYFAQRICGRI